MINFSWKSFDSAVKLAVSKYKDQKFVGVYGIPRGGLCLAVALSHHLKIPLLDFFLTLLKSSAKPTNPKDIRRNIIGQDI